MKRAARKGETIIDPLILGPSEMARTDNVEEAPYDDVDMAGVELSSSWSPKALHDKGPTRYYTDLGFACDALLRCKDCQRLVTHDVLTAHGCCPRCGTRRVVEITTLSPWEWVKIRLGLIQFPYRREFLREFSIS